MCGRASCWAAHVIIQCTVVVATRGELTELEDVDGTGRSRECWSDLTTELPTDLEGRDLVAASALHERDGATPADLSVSGQADRAVATKSDPAVDERSHVQCNGRSVRDHDL